MSWAVHVAGCSWCGTAAQHIKGFLAKKISNTYKIIIIIIIIGKKNQNSPLFPPSLLVPITLLTPHHSHIYTHSTQRWMGTISLYKKSSKPLREGRIRTWKLLCARSASQLATH